MEEFRRRLIEAMGNMGMSQAELSARANISKPRISQYVNGKYEPKQDALLKLAKVLDVDVVWLMGYDVPMQKSADESPISLAEDAYLYDQLRQMTIEEKEELLNYIKFIISKRK